VANLQLGVTSSNLGLIPASGLVFGGSGQSRTLSMTPALNQFGSNVTVTITVTDADGASASSGFVVNVAAVNDPPTISSITDTNTDEDTLAGPLSFTIGDVDSPISALTLSGGSSDTTIVPISNITFAGSGSSRTVSILPATNQFGTVTITVTVSDGSLSTSRNFVLTINPVNDPPFISSIASQTTDEDT